MIEKGIQWPSQAAVSRMLLRLTDSECTILCARFGLTDGIPRSLDSVADDFGLTRIKSRQIELGGLKKLRHMSQMSSVDELGSLKPEELRAIVGQKCFTAKQSSQGLLELEESNAELAAMLVELEAKVDDTEDGLID